MWPTKSDSLTYPDWTDKLLRQELCAFSYAVAAIHVILIASVLTKITHKIIMVKIKQ